MARKKNLTLDPEFVRKIMTIYGKDTDLDGRTIKQLYKVWNENPDIIRNTYNLKLGIANMEAATERTVAPTRFTRITLGNLTPEATVDTSPRSEVAQDDLSSISNFNDAFREANKRKLRLFKWKSTKANPSGLFTTEVNTKVTPKVSGNPVSLRPLPIPKPKDSGLLRIEPPDIDYIKYKRYHLKYPLASLLVSWNPEVVPIDELKYIFENRPIDSMLYGEDSHYFSKNRGFTPMEIFRHRMGLSQLYQKGGKVDLNKLQKAFIAYLIEQSGAKSEAELQDFVQTIGQDGLKQLYQKFILNMQTGTNNVLSAANGAKLNYIKSLRGECPEGYELGYFKLGGLICAKCVEKKEKVGAIPFKPMSGEKGTKVVNEFKKDFKKKKGCPKKELGGQLISNEELLDFFKCGGKTKKKAKKDCSGGKMACGGLVRKSDKKVPIREKFIESDKCGGKTKKKKK